MTRVFAVTCGLIMMGSSIFAAAQRTGPRLTDAAFFGMLDLGRPELAEVNAAVQEKDWPAARHELASYMRARKTPRWGTESHLARYRRDGANTRADDALEHRFTIGGITRQFGEHIDWKFNPTSAPGSKWPVNHEWTWQFNRVQVWGSLGAAYLNTHDEKYAAEFVREMRSWIRDCPVPTDEADNEPFSNWRTIEAGIRMNASWPAAFFSMLHSKSFDDDSLVLMLKGFADHAEYLYRFQTSGNWLAMEANGLYHVGSLFPEFKDAPEWRAKAMRIFNREITAQVYPDGAQIELAPGYHIITLENFLGPVDMAASTGIEPPADYASRVEPMFRYLMYSMQPTRQAPPLNDSGPNNVMRSMTTASRLYPDRADFKWFATDGAEGKPPKETSHEFPFAGQFIMRSGWGRDDLWLCMDGGPFGFKHQHEDKLSVLITAYGEPLLVEGGLYTYDASDWRKYVLSSRAHNVVLVDGLGQNRKREPRDTHVVKQPLPHVWKSTPDFDFARAYYDEGWGPDGKRVTRQVRNVWFLKKKGFFVVQDEFYPEGFGKHAYEALFHLNADEAKTEIGQNVRVATANEGPNLTILSAGTDGVKIIKGQKNPVQGYTAEGGRSYEGMRPIPTALFSRSARWKTKMSYILYPTPEGKPCPIASMKLTGNKLTLQMTDGRKETLKPER